MATAAKCSSKCNAKAVQIRQEGNQLFKQRSFQAALGKYNESICWAESGSEDLAIGIANRSAVLYEMTSYEFALANIRLAKRHNYPERLMPKLAARERDCHQKLIETPPSDPRITRMYSKLEMNVEANPRIPFLAKGLELKKVSGGKVAVVANRDFKVGDVILHESPLLCSPAHLYCGCDYCSCEFHWLIPCPGCTTTMYCGAECMEKGWKYSHRFECGDVRKKLLENFEQVKVSYLGPRLFFYGLTLFKDDVGQMMEFCKTHPKTGSDAFSVDYTNYDPMEEFKAIHYKTKQPRGLSAGEEQFYRFIADRHFKVFQQSALVKSLFTSKAKKEFMNQCFLDYCRMLPLLEVIGTSFQYTAIGSNFELTLTDSNVATLSKGGPTKFVIHRAVTKGSQLKLLGLPGVTSLSSCSCSNCTGNFPDRDFDLMCDLVENRSLDNMARLNAIQQFIHRYSFKRSVQCSRFNGIMDTYLQMLMMFHNSQLSDAMREKAMSDI